MLQLSFAGIGFERFGKTTRRAAFLSEMDEVLPRQRLYDLIAPFYPEHGKGHRPRWAGSHAADLFPPALVWVV